MTARRIATRKAVRLALLGRLASASVAHAGTYEVRACDAANGVNNSWSASSNNGQLTAYSQCPSGGDDGRGMVARNGEDFDAHTAIVPQTLTWDVLASTPPTLWQIRGWVRAGRLWRREIAG